MKHRHTAYLLYSIPMLVCLLGVLAACRSVRGQANSGEPTSSPHPTQTVAYTVPVTTTAPLVRHEEPISPTLGTSPVMTPSLQLTPTDRLSSSIPLSLTLPDDVPPTPDIEHILGEAHVDYVTIQVQESLPVQVSVHASGYLADGCTAIDQVLQERIDTTFIITITTKRPIDALCTQALVPFDEPFSLDGELLQPGVYTVIVNGVQSSFELTTSNE